MNLIGVFRTIFCHYALRICLG